jgi:hypothetical protein
MAVSHEIVPCLRLAIAAAKPVCEIPHPDPERRRRGIPKKILRPMSHGASGSRHVIETTNRR